MKDDKLMILITDDDKTGRELSKLSDFFTGYLQVLSTDMKTDLSFDITHSMPVGDIGIIGEVINCSDILIKGKTAYIPDFDSLPPLIKKKLKAGIYTIAKSKQVEDNFRAVILDENGIRIKDVTLKKVVTHPETLDTVRSISNQMQLKQMNEKLNVIQELQSYQIAHARDHAIVTPFWDARDYILRAQLIHSATEKSEYLKLAVDRLTSSINALYGDVITSTKHLMKITRFPIFQPSILKQQYISQITQDLQLLTKFIGLQMQVLDYTGQSDAAVIELKKYQRALQEFAYTPLTKHGKSGLMLVQDYCPLQNAEKWLSLSTEIQPFLKLDCSAMEAVYLVTTEDLDDE